jgi:hypothetical protein
MHIDDFLALRWLPGTLPYRDNIGIFAALGQQHIIDKRIVGYHLGSAQST